MGSCGGAILGLALLAGATVLLWWNEGDAVKAQQSLIEAERALSGPEGAGGGLTYATGRLAGDLNLADKAFGVFAPPSLALQRSVEVFQWKEHAETKSRRVPDGRGGEVTEKTTTHRYSSDWEGNEIRSSKFKHEHDHRNPPWGEALASASSRTALPFSAESWRQRLVTLAEDDDGPDASGRRGGRTLSLGPTLLRKAERFASLSPEPSRVREVLGGSSAIADGAYVYSEVSCAPPREPRAGCVRLRWQHAPLEEVSLLAKAQPERGGGARGGSASAVLVEWPNAAGAGYELALLEFGRHSASGMLASAASAQSLLTWLKRGGGVLLTWAGWALLFGPAQYLATWIPLLSGAVGCLLSLIALGVALAHALTVIALAWIAHRPVLALTLLAAAAASLFLGVGALRTNRKGGPAAASSSSSTAGARAAANHGEPAGAAHDEIKQSLAKLKQLYEQGLVNEKDYERKKDDILARM